MNLIPLIDTAGISIAFDQDNGWLYSDWKGVHDQDSSRQGCLLMLEALRRQPCRKILNDNSNIIHTSFQITEGGIAWLREMRAAGLECLAWVYPRHFESRQATEGLLPLLGPPAVVGFEDLATAYMWLKKYELRNLVPNPADDTLTGKLSR
ncbi:hypothetical protein [Hymenobacter persicinus]|uniref:STAS/SEC14 domain-containing protein n=1 Tax=Hymenobacter persicinus TaxID=2025506 RepID=A0A4Q5LG32_9BACT|nr:hypothetical protein [Hymenobacter persicinus]RYU80102.1 hypothetical protein EWM57_09165 [Hymenobacter persicinus]